MNAETQYLVRCVVCVATSPDRSRWWWRAEPRTMPPPSPKCVASTTASTGRSAPSLRSFRSIPMPSAGRGTARWDPPRHARHGPARSIPSCRGLDRRSPPIHGCAPRCCIACCASGVHGRCGAIAAALAPSGRLPPPARPSDACNACPAQEGNRSTATSAASRSVSSAAPVVFPLTLSYWTSPLRRAVLRPVAEQLPCQPARLRVLRRRAA